MEFRTSMLEVQCLFEQEEGRNHVTKSRSTKISGKSLVNHYNKEFNNWFSNHALFKFCNFTFKYDYNFSLEIFQ